MNDNIYILGYRLQLGCFACPEAYDVYDPKDNQVGYIRLRHGNLTVWYPDYGTDLVYETSEVKGDGIFDSNERFGFLNKCVEAIQQHQLNKLHEAKFEDFSIEP